MITVTLSMAPARVPIVPDTRMISAAASPTHLAGSIGAIAVGVAILLAMVVAVIFQLAVLAVAMLAQAFLTLVRLLAFPLVILMIVYLLLLAAHANGRPVPNSLTHSAPNQITTSAVHPGRAERAETDSA
jgi:hypothetical protein